MRLIPIIVVCGLHVVSPLGRTAAAQDSGGRCGVERWAVKTLSDPLAAYVELGDVIHTTVAALNALSSRTWAEPERRHPPEEMTVYEVTAIVRHVKGQEDRDVHVVLEDPQKRGMTLIAEVVDPTCPGAAESPHIEALKAARAMFLELLRAGRPNDPKPLLGRLVQVRGVGFFDFEHGQAGRAPNNIELHPVLSIQAVD